MKRIGIIVIMSLMIISGCGRKCAKSGCNNHATLDSRYCAWHSYTNSIPKKSSSTYSSSSSYSSSSTNNNIPINNLKSNTFSSSTNSRINNNNNSSLLNSTNSNINKNTNSNNKNNNNNKIKTNKNKTNSTIHRLTYIKIKQIQFSRIYFINNRKLCKRSRNNRF